jgi:hypothetical protein
MKRYQKADKDGLLAGALRCELMLNDVDVTSGV